MWGERSLKEGCGILKVTLWPRIGGGTPFLLSPTKTFLVIVLSGGRGGLHSGTPNLLNDLVLVVLTMTEMITAAW